MAEVRDAQRGLLKIILQARRTMGGMSAGPETQAALAEVLSRASRLLDFSEQFVPRP